MELHKSNIINVQSVAILGTQNLLIKFWVCQLRKLLYL